jgi:hypothetical protein
MAGTSFSLLMKAPTNEVDHTNREADLNRPFNPGRPLSYKDPLSRLYRPRAKANRETDRLPVVNPERDARPSLPCSPALLVPWLP